MASTGLAEVGGIYAPADLIAWAVLWAVGLAAFVMLCCRPSWAYFRPEPEGALR